MLRTEERGEPSVGMRGESISDMAQLAIHRSGIAYEPDAGAVQNGGFEQAFGAQYDHAVCHCRLERFPGEVASAVSRGRLPAFGG